MESKNKGEKPQEEKQIKLDLLHGFGSWGSTRLKEGAVFLDEETLKIGYPMGKYFAIKTVEKAEMNFIKLHENLESIESLCISKNRKTLAVSERIRGEKYPQVSIYNIKNSQQREKERTFRYTETKSESIVHMNFANEDTRFLVCLTGDPDGQVIFLDTTRMKPIGTAVIGSGATRVSVCPKDNHIITVTGRNILRFLRVQENSFKQLNEVSKISLDNNFTDHAWFDEQKLIVATELGDVYVIQNYEVIQHIQTAIYEDQGVVSMAVFSRGVIFGSNESGFSIWLKYDENEMANYDGSDVAVFTPLRKWTLERRSRVNSIDISPNEEMVAVSLESNDIATCMMSFLVPSATDMMETVKFAKFKSEKVKFDYLYSGFHNGPVNNIDVCLHRPLIVTCSQKDSTIRIWNYLTNKCELARRFTADEEEALGANVTAPLRCVTIHPSGYYLAAGFIDKMRFYHILNEHLRLYRDISVKNASIIKFAYGGSMVAVAYPRGVKTLQYNVAIYHAYTLENIYVSSTPAHSTQAMDLLWAKRDHILYSCGLDGGINVIKITEDGASSNYKETIANVKLYSMLENHNDNIFCVGDEAGTAVVYEYRPGCQDLVKKHKMASNFRLTQICSIYSLYRVAGIIGGTELGQILTFNSSFNPVPYDVISGHNGPVKNLISSPDGRFMFSVSTDGTVFIYQVTETSGTDFLSRKEAVSDTKGMEDRVDINPKYLTVSEELADIILLDRNEILVYKLDIENLKFKIQDIENQIEIKLHDFKTKSEKEKGDLRDKFHMELSKESQRYDELLKEKSGVEKDTHNLLKQMETNHMKAVEELESLYEKKLAFENEKYLQLEQELIEEKNKNIDKIKSLEQRHVDTIERLEGKYKESYTNAQSAYESTKQTAEDLRLIYEEKLNQQEEEHEIEIRERETKYRKLEEQLRAEMAKISSENEILRRDNKNANDARDTFDKQKGEFITEKLRLEQKLAEASTRNERIQAQMLEREEAIKKKDKKIHEYKFKISDLQKSKHVLTYRTTEMRKSLEPKEAQIEKLKEELFKLEGECETMKKASQHQTEKLVNKEKRIKMLSSQLEEVSTTLRKKENRLDEIIMKIFNFVTKTEQKLWGKKLEELYHEYAEELNVKDTTTDPKGSEEMTRQIDYLEKSIKQMNKSTEKLVRRREEDIRRKMHENSDLLVDLNELRQKNKQLEAEISSKTRECDGLYKEKKILNDEIGKYKILLQRAQAGQREPQTLNQGNMMQSNVYDNKPQTAQQLGMNTTMPSIWKKTENQATQQRGKVIKGSMFDMKAQATSDRNKLYELMAEMDICNQRLIQQELEIKNLRGKLRKNGLLEEALDSGMDMQSNRIQVDDADPSQAQFRPISRQRPIPVTTNNFVQSRDEKMQSMKTSLNVRANLQRMSAEQQQGQISDNQGEQSQFNQDQP